MNNEMTTEYMSNEEVIEVLKGIVFNGFDRTTRKERQALDLAIKALQERPQGEYVDISKIEHKAYNEGFKDGVEQGIKLSERPQGKRSRYKRRRGMSNDKLNDAIKTIKELCEVQKTCIECPMNCNCGNCPKDWEEEKNNA